ncbi:MAG: 50S ribosomal protein L6 [Defluviitaleaceae bacterium]|nr:50S ribosomal protein L6 [Defluviitaleaceae bacterium]
MSRVGKMPITVPAGVVFDCKPDNTVTVKGPKGTLTRKLPDGMNIAVEAGEIVIRRPDDTKQNKAFHGLTRMLIFNMVEGVTNGFSKTLDIVGTGYRASKEGNKLTLLLGYSHPVIMIDPEGVESTCETATRIIVSGVDKEKIGQYAAEIRAKRPPEPYKGKGVRYHGEHIIRKAGKAGKK